MLKIHYVSRIALIWPHNVSNWSALSNRWSCDLGTGCVLGYHSNQPAMTPSIALDIHHQELNQDRYITKLMCLSKTGHREINGCFCGEWVIWVSGHISEGWVLGLGDILPLLQISNFSQDMELQPSCYLVLLSTDSTVPRPDPYTVKCHYNAVQYNIIFHTAL